MLAVCLLGPIQVLVDGRAVEVPGSRTQAVLARLALGAGAVVGTDWLIADVWGPAAPSNALNALQVRVSQIRRVLGRDAVRATRPGYVLDVTPADVDALAAETAITEARQRAPSDPAEASRLLAGALGRWRGPAFGGLDDAPFAVVAAARWEELRLGALEDHLRLELDAGRAIEVLPGLEALAAAHPLREPFHELLVIAYGSLGRQADALAAYRRVRERLVEELGIDPGPRLQELEVGVLRQDPSVVGHSRRPATPPPDPPDEAGRGPATGNLPRPISRLLHRAADAAAVEQLLAEHQLVTITGPAGVGKTRLAIELAGQAASRRDGVWFVGLDGLDRADHVADTIAAVIGAPLDQPLIALRTRLRGADAVLVVDNCEHLDDGPALVVRELLEHCPTVTVLATSQRPLGVPGEVVWPLRPLARAEAVELFVLRTTELNPRIIFDEPTLQSAAAVCAALDDLPLALELAARRCGVLGVDEVAERLRDRFELLADRRSGRPPRHQTLSAAIGWSYDLLFPDAQTLLQVLAVFPDGASMEAVDDVATGVGLPEGEVLDLLAQLVDRSLVVADHSGRTPRYRLLNSIRAFAAARAQDDAAMEAMRAAHAAWVVRFAAACFRGLRTERQGRWLATLRDERANVDVAFEWLVTHDPDAALGLANDLYLGWLITGDNSAGASRLDQAWHAATTATPELRARARSRQAVMLARIGRHDEAVPMATWALAAIEGGDPHAVALTRSIVGQVYALAGRVDEGSTLMESARQELADCGDTWAEAICVFNLAVAAGRLGDHEAQERLAAESLELLGAHNDPFVDRLAHRNLALVQLRRGAPSAALDNLDAALVAERSIGYTAEEAATLRQMARAHRLLDDDGRAMEALAQAMAASRRIGDATATDVALADLVAIHRARGEPDAARRLLDLHHPRRSPADVERMPPALQIQIGALILEDGDGSGRAVVERAVTQATDEHDDHQRVLALDLLARLEADDAAEAAHAEADRLAELAGLQAAERPDRARSVSRPLPT